MQLETVQCAKAELRSTFCCFLTVISFQVGPERTEAQLSLLSGTNDTTAPTSQQDRVYSRMHQPTQASLPLCIF